jgi:hypothetical protein
MILVRDVLKIAPDHMQEAKKLARENRELAKRHGYPEILLMTDLTGNFYSLVMETRFDSLSHYEESMKQVMGSKEFQKWYPKLRKFVRGGVREIYSIVD